MDTQIYVWIGVAVFFSLIEAATLGITSIWMALAALVSLVLAALGVGLEWQIAAFLILSLVFLAFTRPVAIKYLKVGNVKTNVDAIVGENAIITMAIVKHGVGQAKVNGQIWTCITEDESEIEIGKEVVVIRVEGVKLIVKEIL